MIYGQSFTTKEHQGLNRYRAQQLGSRLCSYFCTFLLKHGKKVFSLYRVRGALLSSTPIVSFDWLVYFARLQDAKHPSLNSSWEQSSTLPRAMPAWFCHRVG
jgi:hypothetical protein